MNRRLKIYNILVTNGTYSAGAEIEYKGNTYYYGTTAFGTLQEAAVAVEAGGTVNVAAGTYTDLLNLDTDAGIVQKQITFIGEIDNDGNNLVTLAGGVRVGLYVDSPRVQHKWEAEVHFNNFDFEATTVDTQIRLGCAYNVYFNNIAVEGADGMNPLNIQEAAGGAGNIHVSNATFNHGTINIGRANEEHVFSNCDFNEAKVNIVAGELEDAVLLEDCTFLNTLTADSLNDNLYQIRTNGMGVNVKDCTFTFQAADASIFAGDSGSNTLAMLWTRKANMGDLVADGCTFRVIADNGTITSLDAVTLFYDEANKGGGIEIKNASFEGITAEQAQASVNEGGDITFSYEVSFDTIVVDDDWATGYNTGAQVGTGLYYGINAFSNIQDAAAAVNENGTIQIKAGTYADAVELGPAKFATAKNGLTFIGETDGNGNNLVTITNRFKIGPFNGKNSEDTGINQEWNGITIQNVNMEVTADNQGLALGVCKNIVLENINATGIADNNGWVDFYLLSLPSTSGGLSNVEIENCNFTNGYVNLYAGNGNINFRNDTFVNVKTNAQSGSGCSYEDCEFSYAINSAFDADNCYIFRTNGQAISFDGCSFEVTNGGASASGPSTGKTWAVIWTRSKLGSDVTMTDCSFAVADNMQDFVKTFNNLQTTNNQIVLVNPTFNGSIDDFITDLTTATNTSNTIGEIVVQGYTEVIDNVSTTYEGTRIWNDDQWVGEGSNIYVNAAWTDKTVGEQVGEGMYYGLNAFNNMSDAAKKAIGKDDASIQVLGDEPIVAGSAFAATTATITGNATFSWSPWMFIGRDGVNVTTQDATVTFNGATIARDPASGDQSIHVSGAKNGSASTGNGTLNIVNGSDITTEHIVDRNVINLTDSKLTVTDYINVHGRDASESVSGEDDTAYLNVENSTLKITGQPLEIGQEGKGIVNLTQSSILETNSINAMAKGTLNVTGSTVTATSITNAGVISITGDATITVTNALTNSGAITISNGAMLTFNGALNNTGTITVDMTGLEKVEYKLVDYIGSSAATDMVYGTFSANNDYTLSVVDGDLIATKQIDLSNIYVDDDWEGIADGTEVADGKVIGINAFANLQDAANAVNDGGTIQIKAGTYDDKLVLDKSDNGVATGITAVKSIAFIGETDTETGANLVKVTGGIRIGTTGSSNANNLQWNKATSFTNMDIEAATNDSQLWIANSGNLTFTNVKMLATSGEISLTPLEIKNGSWLGTAIFNNCIIQNGYADLYNCNSDDKLFFNGCQFLNAKVNITNNCPAEFNECVFNTVITDGYDNMYLIRTYGKEVIVNDSSFSITTADGTVAAPADGEIWAYIWTRTKDGNVPNQQAILTNCTFNKQDNLFTNGAVTIFNNLETNNEPIVLVNPTFNGSIEDFITDLTTATNATNTFGEIIIQGYTEVIDNVSTTYEDTRLWNDDHWVGEGSDIYVNAAWTDKTVGELVGEGMYYGLNAFNNMADAAKKAIGKDDASIQVLGDEPIVAGSAFAATTATITGNATFKWAPWMFIGRGGSSTLPTQDATVTFDGATIARAASSGDQSIHVSGQEGDGTSKGNGTLNITNASDIATDWIIDKNVINIDKGSTLTTNYLNVAGRPASETPTGEDATAILNVDAAIVNVGSHGFKIGNEGNGIVNLTNGAVFNATSINSYAKGTLNVTDSMLAAASLTNAGAVNVYGESTINAAVTGAVNVQDQATLTESNLGSGDVNVYGTATIEASTFGNLNIGYGDYTTEAATATLKGNVDFTAAYIGTDGATDPVNTLNIGAEASVNQVSYYIRQNGVLNFTGTTATYSYINDYGAINLKDSELSNAGGVNTYIFGRASKNADGKAIVTMDNSTWTTSYTFGIGSAENGDRAGSGKVVLTNGSALNVANELWLNERAEGMSEVSLSLDDSTATLGKLTIGSGAEVKVTNASALTVNGALTNAGTITIDTESDFKVTGLTTNSGTIVIDAANFAGGTKKVVDFNGFATGEGLTDYAVVDNLADGISVRWEDDGDVILSDAQRTVYKVNHEWSTAGYSFGDAIEGEDGFVFGVNAFADVDDAFLDEMYYNYYYEDGLTKVIIDAADGYQYGNGTTSTWFWFYNNITLETVNGMADLTKIVGSVNYFQPCGETFVLEGDGIKTNSNQWTWPDTITVNADVQTGYTVLCADMTVKAGVTYAAASWIGAYETTNVFGAMTTGETLSVGTADASIYGSSQTTAIYTLSGADASLNANSVLVNTVNALNWTTDENEMRIVDGATATVTNTLTNKGIVKIDDATLAAKTVTNSGTIQLDGAAVLTVANGIANSGNVIVGSADEAFTGALNAAITGTGHVQVKNAEMTIGTDNSINVTTVSVGRMTESEIGGSTPGAKVTVNEGAVFRGFGELWVGSENDNRQTAETHDHSYILEVNGGSVHGGNQFTIRNDGYLYAYSGATVTGGAAPIRGDVLLSGTNTLMSFSNSANIYGEATGAGENNGVSTVLVQNGASFVVNGPVSIGKSGVDTRQGNLVIDGEGSTADFNSLTLYTSGIVTLKNCGALTVSGALTNDGAINVDSSASITVGSMVSTGSVNLASGALLTFNGALTNSGTITVDMTDLTGFEYKVIDFVNDNADASTLGTLEATNGYKLEVRDGDLFAVKDIDTNLVYVNSAWNGSTAGALVYTDEEPNGYFGQNAFAAITDATALTPEKMVVLGGSYSGAQYLNGVDTTIRGGASFSSLYAGQKINTSTFTWTQVTGDINVNVKDGASVSKVAAFGDVLVSGSEVRFGDVNIDIEGGTFSNWVVGGNYVGSASTYDSTVLTGDVNMSISGGTFASYVFAAGAASKTTYAYRSIVDGNVCLTVDTSVNTVTFRDNVAVGAYNDGRVTGDVSVTFTGLGSNLSFSSKLFGCSQGAWYEEDKTTKIREYTTYVEGSRSLSFDEFTGNFAANAMAFQSISFTGNSEVEFTNTSLNMADATAWNFEYGSSARGIAINNFKGDSLNFELTNWEDGQESWDVFSGKETSFTGWDEASVVKFNGVAASYSEGCWTGNGYSLTLEAADGSNKKFVISKLA